MHACMHPCVHCSPSACGRPPTTRGALTHPRCARPPVCLLLSAATQPSGLLVRGWCSPAMAGSAGAGYYTAVRGPGGDARLECFPPTRLGSGSPGLASKDERVQLPRARTHVRPAKDRGHDSYARCARPHRVAGVGQLQAPDGHHRRRRSSLTDCCKALQPNHAAVLGARGVHCEQQCGSAGRVKAATQVTALLLLWVLVVRWSVPWLGVRVV